MCKTCDIFNSLDIHVCPLLRATCVFNSPRTASGRLLRGVPATLKLDSTSIYWGSLGFHSTVEL